LATAWRLCQLLSLDPLFDSDGSGGVWSFIAAGLVGFCHRIVCVLQLRIAAGPAAAAVFVRASLEV